ncbi:MAG TPA: SEL1-like repeat protein [Stellaceae bacterium]
MHFRALLLSLALGLSLVAAGPPARAQFYDLDGVYHCLTKTDASCKGETDAPPPPPPPPPAGPTLDSVFGDIRAQQVSDKDMQLLQGFIAKKDPRAVEALAWCKLNGLGGPSDPVAAYFLYGEAAQLGVPNAQANQIAIFETRLTQQQRQDVLMKLQTN